MTRTEATAVARKFIASVTNPDSQWNVNTVRWCLPAGWDLSDAATSGDFMPLTVKNVTNAILHNAVRES